MPADESFDDLMGRLRAGDEEAATAVFHRYARRLIGLARGRLDPLIRRKVDPEDIVQSAFRSFFRGHAEGQYDLANGDSLWGLLAVITLRKCGHRIEYYRAGRRDLQREVAPQPAADQSSLGWEAVAREPTPQEAAILAENVEQLLRPLDERDRRIVQLSLQGHSIPEISEEVGRSERTVYRVLEQVRQRLDAMRVVL